MSENTSFIDSDMSPAALLILDAFNTFDFPGGEDLFNHAYDVLPSLGLLRDRFRAANQPVIFINDQMGRWQDSFDQLLEWVDASGDSGQKMLDALRPEPGEYRLLKPRHSAFFETCLPSLLHHLGVSRIVVTGFATDSCLLSTVMDAHVRRIASLVPMDATAAQSNERMRRTLTHLRDTCGVPTPMAAHVRPESWMPWEIR